jgi:hypothetical protein
MIKVQILNGPHEGEIITINEYVDSFLVLVDTDFTHQERVKVEYKICGKKTTGIYIAKMSGVSVSADVVAQLPVNMIY